MKFYETMFIVKPTLQAEEITAKVDFYKNLIVENGGKIATTLDMGMRNLAYEIKKNKRGYYYVIYFEANPSFILELERRYRINEDILRFIVIKYDSKKEQKMWHALCDKANEQKSKKTEEKHEEQGDPHQHLSNTEAALKSDEDRPKEPSE